MIPNVVNKTLEGKVLLIIETTTTNYRSEFGNVIRDYVVIRMLGWQTRFMFDTVRYRFTSTDVLHLEILNNP